MIQLGAKECLIVDQDKAIDYDLGKIKALMERCGIVITERKKGKAAWTLPSLRIRPSAFSGPTIVARSQSCGSGEHVHESSSCGKPD